MSHFAKFEPDIHNSTYRHVIEYLHQKPKIGYSKKAGLHESPADKRVLLAGILGRLLPKALEDGLLRFTVFKRNPQGQNGLNTEVKVIEIFEDGYALSGAFEKDKLLERFITTLITTRSHERAKTIIKGTNTTHFVGTTHEELINHCTLMKAYGDLDLAKRLYHGVASKNKWGNYAEDAQISHQNQQAEQTTQAIEEKAHKARKTRSARTISDILKENMVEG